jgi:hypothetical protein
MTGTQSPMVATELRFNWLNDHADGWQFGETGILEALSERFDPDLAVEIGAGDGQSLPLTLGFLLEKGVKTMLFEADELRQNALKMTKKNAIIMGAFDVKLLQGYDLVFGAKLDKSFVVVDVDGQDWPIAEEVLKCGKPQVMMIEHYDEFGPRYGRCEPEGLPPRWCLGLLVDGFSIQAPAKEIEKRIRWYGYTLIAKSRVNSLFVRNDLLPSLEGC